MPVKEIPCLPFDTAAAPDDAPPPLNGTRRLRDVRVPIRDRFEAYHARHPEVYNLLVRMARAAQQRGQRFGIKALFEIVRWQRYVERDEGAAWKLNNVFTAWYARRIMEQEPDLQGFFETRELRSE